MEAMDNPLCQFGPGGEYRKVYPASAKPLSEPEATLSSKGFAKLAKDLGLELPLVSIGPAGIHWQKSAEILGKQRSAEISGKQKSAGISGQQKLAEILAEIQWQKKKASHLKSVVGSLLEVLRKVRPGDGEVADEKLVASQIAAADKALAKLTMKESQVPQAASAPIAAPATPARVVSSGRVSAKGDFVVSPEAQTNDRAQKQENGYAASNSHTETIGNTSVYSGFQNGAWLFPDNAGDWRPLGSNKGNRLRTRRRTGKKKLVVAGSQAQGSLFASLR